MASSVYLCLLRAVFLVCFVNPLIQGLSEDESVFQNPHHQQEENLTGLPIVTFKWHHVETPYLVIIWVFVAGLAKLSVVELNHHVISVVPESGLLIILGFILGGIVWGADRAQTFKLLPPTFFYYLLPQIILDASYFMPNKLFFSNLGAILIYAIFGTCWNAATVGLSLWGCYEAGVMGNLDIGLLQFLLFGSLIAAVDPVAVIAVFEEVHVNEVLFILVFGESLLNDGVTVVLYNVFDAFVALGGPRIDAAEIFKGIFSFVVVAFGGSFLGIGFAILLSLLTRCTKHIQIIEAGFVFVVGYLAYLTAEMLSLSAILSITFCGICCQKYVNANMDEKSVTTVRHAMKLLANGSETMIFLFLGVTAIDTEIWVWNTGFILLTLLFVFIYRIIGTFLFTWMLNKFRLVPIEVIDQVVMSYGGLRGAVAYGLAALLDEDKIPEKNLMISTTLIVVYFTVILQGITMKPLVQWLKVKRSCFMFLQAFDHILAAVEDICGRIGDNWWTRGWNRFEENYISWLLMKPKARKNRDYLFSIFHKLNLEDAINYVSEVRAQTGVIYCTILSFTGRMRWMTSMPIIFYSSTCTGAESMYELLFIHTHTHTYSLPLIWPIIFSLSEQHRHKYSRSHFSINQNEDEVQEIFQRTMRSRLESFKSTKMGVNPAKKITKHHKKELTHKVVDLRDISFTWITQL
uniref:Sodium/hydrogen exchanger n=1 Tax=Cyprinus carpio carpio TaxID=630221 RepID=A0A9J8DAI4_CYPCA